MSNIIQEERRQDRKYLEKVKSIVTGGIRGSRGPGILRDYLIIGNMEDAHNVKLLKRLKVTHVLNCAAVRDYSHPHNENPYSEVGIDYEEFEAHDNEGYPILRHFGVAKRFIDGARKSDGRVLVHCEMGVNRSGAICIAYMMVQEELTLFQALRQAKLERPVLLVNEGFQKQLIQFARERDLLERRRE